MRFQGSIPFRTVDGVRVRVRNRLNMWVTIPLKYPDSVRFYDYYQDFAGKIIKQTQFGTKTQVEPPYLIERLIDNKIVRMNVREPEPPIRYERNI